ncbi:hypothetical protein HY837_04330 [archaeon]|nr:hypothetical protein [archaeon]
MNIGKILDGKKLAESLQEKIKQDLKILEITPKLDVLTVGINSATEAYINNKKKFLIN